MKCYSGFQKNKSHLSDKFPGYLAINHVWQEFHYSCKSLPYMNKAGNNDWIFISFKITWWFMNIPPYVLSSIPFVSHSGENVLNRTFIKVFPIILQKLISKMSVTTSNKMMWFRYNGSMLQTSDRYFWHVL